MYATVPMLEEPELQLQDYAVWLSLCSFSVWEWTDGKPIISLPEKCFPTMKAIAARVHCSVDTVKRSLKRLETAGHIVRTHQFRDDGGQAANNYTLRA